jgi:hypothetical protein
VSILFYRQTVIFYNSPWVSGLAEEHERMICAVEPKKPGRRSSKPRAPIGTPWQQAVIEAWIQLRAGRELDGVNDKTRRNFEKSVHAITLSAFEEMCRAAQINPSAPFRMPEVIAAGAVNDTKSAEGPLSGDRGEGMSFPVIANVLAQLGITQGGVLMEPITEDELRDLLIRRHEARQRATKADQNHRGGLQPPSHDPEGG